jgi:hypothetical protein
VRSAAPITKLADRRFHGPPLAFVL